MSIAYVRLLVSASAFLLISGCGGGSGAGGTGGGGGGNPPTTVTFNFRQPTPIALAAKIGSGAFTAQTLSAGKLSLSIPTGTTNFAVAYLCPAFNRGAGTATYGYQFVFEASTADGTAFTPTACPHSTSIETPGTLAGTVDASAIAGVSTIIIDAQGGNALADTGPIAPGDFSFPAPAGTDRVEVLAYKTTPFTNYGGLSLVAARNFNGQVVPGQLNGGNPVVLGAADSITLQPITYNGVPSGFSTPLTLSTVDIGSGEILLSTGGTPNQYPALPSGAMESGDFYHFASISEANGEAVGAEMTSTGSGPVTIAFPVPWGYAGPTAAALPTFNFDYSGFAGKTGVIQSGIISWSTGNLAQSWYQVSATDHYQNGSTVIAIPDLSRLSGFLAAPSSGTQMIWAAEISQQSAGAFQPLTANTTASIVENVGVFAVP